MNEQAPDFDDSTIQRAKHFDALCDEFELQCSGGDRPSIESFLLRVDGPEKQPLPIELIAIEMHCQRKKGESIAFAEYQSRFPGLSVGMAIRKAPFALRCLRGLIATLERMKLASSPSVRCPKIVRFSRSRLRDCTRTTVACDSATTVAFYLRRTACLTSRAFGF